MVVHKLVSLLVFAFPISLIHLSCENNEEYDLAIENINFFDPIERKVLKHKTILIKDEKIAAVIPVSERWTAKKVVNGKGKLVTPGFIDTHIHLTDLYGDYEKAPEYLSADSLDNYRQELADTYLKYGSYNSKGGGPAGKMD